MCIILKVLRVLCLKEGILYLLIKVPICSHVISKVVMPIVSKGDMNSILLSSISITGLL